MKKLTIVIFLVLTVFLASNFESVEASSYELIGSIEHATGNPYMTFWECKGDPNGDPKYLHADFWPDQDSFNAIKRLSDYVNDATVTIGLMGHVYIDLNCERIESFFDGWTYGDVYYYQEWISESTLAHRYKIKWYYNKFYNPAGVYKYYTIYESTVNFPSVVEEPAVNFPSYIEEPLVHFPKRLEE